MATAEQVKALIRSHAEGDDSRFFSIAMQVAAQAARNGHSKFAEELRKLVDQAKKNKIVPRFQAVPLVQPRGELAGLLTASYPKLLLPDMALDLRVRERLARITTEQRQRSRIRQHGYSPLRKILLVGPPGTGKTMTAAVLAGELGIPLFAIQLHGLITKYMGETAAKLRLIFDAIRDTRAVYLFDEFDALGSERAAKNDVGEIRRVLNSFLVFLEHDDSESLIVCATNYLRLLDKALFRRFDIVIQYSLPSAEIREKIIRGRMVHLDTKNVDWRKVIEASEGFSHAELASVCEQAAKSSILANTLAIRTEDMLEAIGERLITQS